ncbi:unnamed protein product [marine sediment metagenome]|uniref:Uncharacterized protein n=1 Tax=marine sediment metagenome TaxID=412755 RepID=X1GUS6_9ZZZZ
MFTVKCPICGGRLTIDERMRKIINHISKEEASKKGEKRFDDAVSRVEEKRRERERKLEEAHRLQEEKRRRAQEAFEKAREKAEKEGDIKKPPSIFGD